MGAWLVDGCQPVVSGQPVVCSLASVQVGLGLGCWLAIWRLRCSFSNFEMAVTRQIWSKSSAGEAGSPGSQAAGSRQAMDTKLLVSQIQQLSVLNCCTPTGLEYHANPQHVLTTSALTSPVCPPNKDGINPATKPNQTKPHTFTKWRATKSSVQASQE
jgi:hypothetical protein